MHLVELAMFQVEGVRLHLVAGCAPGRRAARGSRGPGHAAELVHLVASGPMVLAMRQVEGVACT